MNREDKLKRCQDCYNNFYNGQGAKECWSLANAKPQTVYIVGTWQMNPMEHTRPVERLNCWHPASGMGMSVMKRMEPRQ